MNGISVALASYNGAAYIGEQLESLAAQTLLPRELVVSDDGSTDDTLGIVKQFQLSAPFPVILAQSGCRLGFADNFLNAAEHCRGDIVAFCDQDDVWLPRKLEICASRLEQDESLIALHTLTVTDENLNPTGLRWTQGITLDHAFNPLELDPFETGFGNSMIFRRELLGLIDRKKRPRHPFTTERPLSHDTWIYMLAAALGRVSHIAEPLILYRQHGTNASGALAHRGRLSDRFSIPLRRYEEQCAINQSMTDLLHEISQTSSPFVEQASTAAARFKQRASLSCARATTYLGRTLRERSAADQTYRDILSKDSPNHHDLSVAPRLKTLCLGVLNIRKFLPNAGTRPN